MADLQQVFEEAVKLNRQITQFLKFSTYPDYDDLSGLDGVSASNAIKLTNKFQKKEKSLDKGKKMCGKALKTRLIFRGRAHEIHS